ncbi:hypothetical protein P8452_32223 [Trifolium repens]|nr:hypothetical protein P8452_32223 [Trifolium repens]
MSFIGLLVRSKTNFDRVFLAMLIQLMNATKELKRISQKLSNLDFCARIGLWLLFLQCVRDWLILLYNGF